MRAADILTLEVRMKTDKAKAKTDDLVRHQKKAGDKMRGQSDAMTASWKKTGMAIGALVGGVLALNKAFDSMQKATEISRAFETMTNRIGATADEMLNALRPASRGLISDFELMRQTNNALILGLPLTVNQMAEFTEGAVKLGRALGVTAEFSLESLITGMGRQSRLMLDNIGIMVRQDEAYRKYAKQIGKAVDALTKLERTQAFVNEVEFKMKRALEGLEAPINTASEAWQNMATQLANVRLEVLKFVDVAGGGEGGLFSTLAEAFRRSAEDWRLAARDWKDAVAGAGSMWKALTRGGSPANYDTSRTTGGFGYGPADTRTPAMRAQEAAALSASQYALAATQSAAAAEVGYGTGSTRPVGPFASDAGLDNWLNLVGDLDLDGVIVEPMTRMYDVLTLANHGLGEMGVHFREMLGIDEVTESVGELTGKFEELTEVQETTKELGYQMADAFGALAGAQLGAALTGEKSTISFKKIVAQLASTSAAQAIYHTALGFAAMTPWGAPLYGPFQTQFKAAAIFGTAAGALSAVSLVAGSPGGGGDSTGGGLEPLGLRESSPSLAPPVGRPQEIHIFVEGQGFIQNTTEFARELSDEINRQNSAGGLS